MKKKIVPVFILAVTVIVVIAGVFFYLQQRRPMAIEQVFPSGPVGYLRVAGVAKTWDEVRATQFWKTVSAIDYIGAMKEMGVDEKTQAMYWDLKNKLTSPEVQKIADIFLGKEFALAMYPAAVDNMSASDPNQEATGIIFVSRLRPELKMADTLATMIAKMSKDVTVQEQEFLKRKITVVAFKTNPTKIAYTRVGDLFVIGLGVDTVKNSLSVYYKGQSSLAQDMRYQNAKAQSLSQAQVVGYVDAQLFINNVKEQLLKMAAAQKEKSAQIEAQINARIKQFAMFQMASFSANMGTSSQLKTVVHLDRGAIPAEMRMLYECASVENKTLAFVPSDVVGYQWSACNDFGYYWHEAIKGGAADDDAGKSAAFDASVAQLEETIGKSIEKDIIPMLGQEMGGYLRDVDFSGAFPVPKLLLFVKVTDRKQMEDLLASLGQRQPMLLGQKEDYNGVKLTYFGIPFMNNIEPAYCFYSDYLLIATTRQILKESIDLGKIPGSSVVGNADFQKLDNLALTGKANSVFLLNTKRTADKLTSLIDWGQKWFDDQMVKREAFKAGSLKRMNDVEKLIQENEATIKTLKQEKTKFEADSTAANDKLKELPQVEAEIDRVDKFIVSLEKGMEPQLAEEKDLIAVKNNPSLKLPPDGEKRLKETQDSLQKKKDKVASLQEEKKNLLSKKEALTVEQTLRDDLTQNIVEKNDKINQLQGEIAEQKKTVQDLEATVKELDKNQPLTSAQRTRLVEQFFKPLVKAVGMVKGISSRVNTEPSTLSAVTSWGWE